MTNEDASNAGQEIAAKLKTDIRRVERALAVLHAHLQEAEDLAAEFFNVGPQPFSGGQDKDPPPP